MFTDRNFDSKIPPKQANDGVVESQKWHVATTEAQINYDSK